MPKTREVFSLFDKGVCPWYLSDNGSIHMSITSIDRWMSRGGLPFAYYSTKAEAEEARDKKQEGGK